MWESRAGHSSWGTFPPQCWTYMTFTSMVDWWLQKLWLPQEVRVWTDTFIIIVYFEACILIEAAFHWSSPTKFRGSGRTMGWNESGQEHATSQILPWLWCRCVIFHFSVHVLFRIVWHPLVVLLTRSEPLLHGLWTMLGTFMGTVQLEPESGQPSFSRPQQAPPLLGQVPPPFSWSPDHAGAAHELALPRVSGSLQHHRVHGLDLD